MDISICLCTFRRPDLLARLLAQLCRQRPVPGLPDWEIVVVDNDPAHSARAVLEAFAVQNPGRLRHAHSPSPNISLARNQALALARGRWLALIDDDEEPAEDWLQKLAATQVQTGADLVFGPVLPIYPADMPAWLRDGGYYERPRHPSGTVIGTHDARTGNVWARAESLRLLPGPFDAAFGQTGGEDSLLFRQLQARGQRFVWCDEAAVHEAVPPDRANARWLLRRAHRIGQTWLRGELHGLAGAARLRRMLSLCARAGLQLLVASGLALLLAPLSRIRSFYWLRKACTQWGKLSAATGASYREYAA